MKISSVSSLERRILKMSIELDFSSRSRRHFLLHNDLKGLKTIYTISKRVVRVAKENLSWTFIYNTTLTPIAGGFYTHHRD
jgi:cation transport ATPase